MHQEWQVDAPKGCCALTGRTLQEGEEFFTVLFEEGESFRRVDCSLEGWQGPPEGAFCHFKSRVPVKAKKKRLLVDNEVLLDFFLRLGGESDRPKQEFRFVLALILLRKRVFRYDGNSRIGGIEVWRLTRPGDNGVQEVTNPGLTPDRIEGVSRQLGAILHGDMGDVSQWDADESEAPAVENHTPAQVPDGDA